MMKKTIAILLSLVMILGLAACGNSASQTEQPSTEDTSVESKADTNAAETVQQKLRLKVKPRSPMIRKQQNLRLRRILNQKEQRYW